MKVFTIVNSLSGKCNTPFLCDSDKSCKEFIISNVVNDQSNTLVSLAKYLNVVELFEFSFNDEGIEFFSNYELGVKSIDDLDVQFVLPYGVSSFTVYDVIHPILESIDKEENLNDCNT